MEAAISDQVTAGASYEALRIAVAHDWIMEWAGSERVLSEIAGMFPKARLLTALLNADAVPSELRRAEPSLLQHLPRSLEFHQWLLPLMPASWRLRGRVDDVDLVISSSHACAKAVRIARDIPHLCYCHTPMRYAWNFTGESSRFPRALHLPVRALMAAFRRWDVGTAQRVTEFVANSTAVAERIHRYYGRHARVVHPPVQTEFFTRGGNRSDFFLYVGRLTGYKRPDLVVEAFADLPHKLVVVGTGPMASYLRQRATSNIHFAGRVDDCELRDLYRGARALVYPVDEDFGIGMAEAQACGTPVIGYQRGGATDIVRHGGLGVLVQRQEANAVRRAVEEVHRRTFDYAAISAEAERFSSARFRSALGEIAEETVARWGLPSSSRSAAKRQGAALSA
jgi:glycosyltransferase involved in cell wall biosynthesis